MLMLLFNLIFGIILTIFMAIAMLLIYSLMILSIETKTLENGLIRMIGASKHQLIALLFLQTTIFTVVPAIVLAMSVSLPILLFTYQTVFKEHLSTVWEACPDFSALVYSLVVGFLIPIVASILPMLKVLSQNLTDALNY